MLPSLDMIDSSLTRETLGALQLPAAQRGFVKLTPGQSGASVWTEQVNGDRARGKRPGMAEHPTLLSHAAPLLSLYWEDVL